MAVFPAPAFQGNLILMPLADILVIDDEVLMRGLIAEWLDMAGYTARQAADGWAAIEEIMRARPDLVITDIMMPGHGALLINRLRRDYPEMPIIAMSGNFDAGAGLSSQDALRLGADRVMEKPLDRKTIVAAVAELLQSRKASDARRQP